MIPNLGISLVENGRDPTELIYILMKNIEYLALDTVNTRKAELAIGGLQIDN